MTDATLVVAQMTPPFCVTIEANFRVLLDALRVFAAGVLTGMKCELNALAMVKSTSFPKQSGQLAKRGKELRDESKLSGKELERLKLLAKDFSKEF